MGVETAPLPDDYGCMGYAYESPRIVLSLVKGYRAVDLGRECLYNRINQRRGFKRQLEPSRGLCAGLSVEKAERELRRLTDSY